uniref:F-box domain-containing protein n=1 Tax=Oryza rufipogon TaxID=4529 RepID=A0A0E0ND88_ORYRU
MAMTQTNQAIEVDGERLSPPPPPPAASPAVSAVLENEDLVGEILLRLAFPTTLVRAALACRRWLRVASDPSFLRRFRELHPPRLLGFYVTSKIPPAHPLFVPMPPPARPPELDPVVLRRGNFSLAYEGYTTSIYQCRNGSILLFKERHDRRELKYAVHRPLQHPERGLLAIPFSSTHDDDDDDDVEPDLGFDGENVWGFHFGEDGGSQLYRLSVMFTPRGATSAWFYAFRDGGWHVHTKATAQLPGLPPESAGFVVVRDKAYLAATASSVLVLDLKSSSLYTIQLPDGVEFPPVMMAYNDRRHDVLFGRASDDSGVYIADLKEPQLRIWLLKHGGTGWTLVDTICLREMCANLHINCVGGDRRVVYMDYVGDDAEFLFLKTDECALYLDVKSRQLHKVYEVTEKEEILFSIMPFMMIWPPIFPVRKEIS